MSFRIVHLFVLGIFLLMSSCSISPLSSVPPMTESITLIHTNDIEENVTADTATWTSHGDTITRKVGGFARYQTFLDEVRKRAHTKDNGLLVLDSGDWYIGGSDEPVSGDSITIEALNEINVDYTTIGNHEFDVGMNTLLDRLEKLNSVVLASNIEAENTRFEDLTQDTAIVTVEGIKMGIFGLITGNMKELTSEDNVKEFDFLEPVKTSRIILKGFDRKNVDFVILLSHMSFQEDKELARRTQGIDVILSGHDHIPFHIPRTIENTIISQTGGGLESVDRIDLQLSQITGEIRRYSGGLVRLDSKYYPPDKGMKKILDPFLRRRKALLNEKIGYSKEPLKRNSRKSSPLGNLITNAMREASGASIAIQNAYGIRANLPEGPILEKHLKKTLPFGNKLVTMRMTGRQLLSILEQSATMERGLLQISGLNIKIDLDRKKGNRVRSARVNGNKIRTNKYYRIVTNSFLADGGDRFDTFTNGEDVRVYSDTTLRDAVRSYIRDNSPLKGHEESRYEIQGNISRN